MRALLNGLAIMGLLACTGCGTEEKDVVSFKKAPVAQTPEHVHAAGPNGGEVLEFTDDHSYHAEVTMDATSRDVTVYIYGANLDTPAAIAADAIEFEIDQEGGEEVEIDATAKPRDGEAEGTSSVFTIAGAGIPESAKDLHDFHWHMHIRVGDKEYEAELDHAHHEGEHKHAEGEAHDKDGDKEAHKEGDAHDKDGEKHDHKEGDADHKEDGEKKAE